MLEDYEEAFGAKDYAPFADELFCADDLLDRMPDLHERARAIAKSALETLFPVLQIADWEGESFSSKREQVLCQYQAISSPEQAQKFRDLLTQVEKRFENDVERRDSILNSIERIISSQSLYFSEADKASIAAATLDNIIYPAVEINQSGKNCVPASFEVRIASLYPEKYADLIAQIAEERQFKTLQGAVVDLKDSYLKNDHVDVSAGICNQASLVFQFAFANAGWQTETSADPRRKDHRYSVDQRGNAGIYEVTTARAKTESDGFTRIDYPFLSEEMIERALRGITGSADKCRVSYSELADAPGNVSSLESLKELLRRSKHGDDSRFPLIVSVDPNVIEGKPPGKIGHAMTILDYDPQTGLVELNDTNGYKYDHWRDPKQANTELYKEARGLLQKILASEPFDLATTVDNFRHIIATTQIKADKLFEAMKARQK